MTGFRNYDIDDTESMFRILLLLWSTSSSSTQSAENCLCKEVKNRWKLILIAASALMEEIYRFEEFTSAVWRVTPYIL